MSQRPPVDPSAFGHQTWTEDETVTLADVLSRKLSKDTAASRTGAGNTKFNYLESWKAIQLANSIFGFNGWSCSVVELVPDFIEEERGRFSVGVTAMVRVTLKDGTSHEDVGYGTAELPKKGLAIEKAKKEAVSDARKRALRVFGDALGNCLYDKDHLKRLKTKAGAAGEDLLDYTAVSTQHFLKSEASSQAPSPMPSPAPAPVAPMTSNVQQPLHKVKSEPNSFSPSPPKTMDAPKQHHYQPYQQKSPPKTIGVPKTNQIAPQQKSFNRPAPKPLPGSAPKTIQPVQRPPAVGVPSAQPTANTDQYGGFDDLDMEAFEAAEQSLRPTHSARS